MANLPARSESALPDATSIFNATRELSSPWWGDLTRTRTQRAEAVIGQRWSAALTRVALQLSIPASSQQLVPLPLPHLSMDRC